MARPSHALATTALSLTLLSTACFDSVEQPIAFNHSVHVEQLECGDCHKHFSTATYSGLPRLEVCVECHEEALTESPEEEKLLAYASKEEEIPWRNVYGVADHVFYSHRTHVVTAQIECETCHGDIGALTAPPPRPLVDQSMSWCLDCHEENSATTDCIHCHR
jgi:hypothetical protein